MFPTLHSGARLVFSYYKEANKDFYSENVSSLLSLYNFGSIPYITSIFLFHFSSKQFANQ